MGLFFVYKYFVMLNHIDCRIIIFELLNSVMEKKRRVLLVFVLLFSSFYLFSQVENSKISLGLKSGVGSEFKNSDYTFTNRFYKIDFNYQVIKTKNFVYEIVIQPEVDFGTHQMLNFYFVTPDEVNYMERRDRYLKLKDVNQYVLNIGFLARKSLYRSLSIFVQASVGPMISDTDTERLSKGFAFSDVLSLGLSYQYDKIRFDLTPSVRHVSNAGFQSSNAGFNTKNIEFGFSYNL